MSRRANRADDSSESFRPSVQSISRGTAVTPPAPPAYRAPHDAQADAPAGSTMPSYDLPVLDPPGAPRSSNARAVAAWLVVVLVLGALAAGFVLGFAVARSM